MKPIVKVVWLDAQDHADKWVDAEDAEAFTDVDCQVVSVGFLVRKTDKYVTIAGDWDPADQDYGRVTKVPMGMVRSIDIIDQECKLQIEKTGEETQTTS